MVDRFIVVDTVSGRTEGEFLLSFLKARGIQCELSQEAIGWVYGMGVGTLAEVEILVPSRQGKQARAALKEYHKTKHKSTEKTYEAKRSKAKLYLRYPLSSVLIYNGSTILHFLLGGIGIMLGYRFSPWVGYSFGVLYLVFSFTEMYLIMPLKVCALKGIRQVVTDVVAELKAGGETVPEPSAGKDIAVSSWSGSHQICIVDWPLKLQKKESA